MSYSTNLESGPLEPGGLPATVAKLAKSGATGCLEIEHDGAVSRAFFRDGYSCGCLVFAGFKPLGVLLLEHGVIDMDVLEASLADVATKGRPQGEVLVEAGHLTEERLEYWLRVQQGERLRGLLALVEGDSRFDAAVELPAWTKGLSIPVQREVRRVLCSESGQAHVDALLADLGDEPIVGPTSVDPAFGLGEEESRFVESLTARSADVREAAANSGLPLMKARGVLATLACFGHLDTVKAATDRRGPEETAKAGPTPRESVPSAAPRPRREGRPRAVQSSWQAPSLGADGVIRFESQRDLDASIDLFIKSSAILVATETDVGTELLRASIVSPDRESQVEITCSLAAIPEQGLALLRIQDSRPEEVIAVLKGRSAHAGKRASQEPDSRSIASAAPPEESRPDSPRAERKADAEPRKPTTADAIADSKTRTVPPSGDLEAPAHPAELLGGKQAEGEEARGVSPLQLIVSLRAAQEDFSVEISTKSGGQYVFEALGGTELQATVELSTIARTLAEPGTSYRLTPISSPPQRRRHWHLHKLQWATTKSLIRRFEEDVLEEGLGSRMSLCPQLSGTGRRASRRLDFSAPQSRLVARGLDGTRTVDEILNSGVGRRSAWEVIYLLELRGGLEWVTPPERVKEDPVAQRWRAIQSKDYFGVLGLHWSSHPGLVEKAYRALNELYGPSGKLRGSAPEIAEKLWERISKAHAVLSDEKSRREYRKQQYPKMNFSYQAELLVGQAELARLRNDEKQARMLLESALDMYPLQSAREMLHC